MPETFAGEAKATRNKDESIGLQDGMVATKPSVRKTQAIPMAIGGGISASSFQGRVESRAI
jgi:hypothetical protein